MRAAIHLLRHVRRKMPSIVQFPHVEPVWKMFRLQPEHRMLPDTVTRRLDELEDPLCPPKHSWSAGILFMPAAWRLLIFIKFVGYGCDTMALRNIASVLLIGEVVCTVTRSRPLPKSTEVWTVGASVTNVASDDATH